MDESHSLRMRLAERMSSTDWHLVWNRRSFACVLAIAAASTIGATACVAEIGDTPASQRTPVGPPTPPFEPAPGTMSRLTTTQYQNTIVALVGPEIVLPTRTPSDGRILGLVTLGAGINALSDRGIEQYESAAYDIAGQAMGTEAVRARLVPCSPDATVDDACATQFVTRFGRSAYRRPLDALEVEALVAIAAEAATALGDFHLGLKYAMGAILQSPNFIYRLSLGHADATSPYPLPFDAFEIAQRMSFLAWDTTPDETLLDAAASGALLSDAGITEQMDRLLADERARDGVRAFFSDMLRLADLAAMNKDPTIFVHFSPDVGPLAREETLSDVEHMVFEMRGDYRDLFTTHQTFIDSRLAAIYNVPAPTLVGQGLFEFPRSSIRVGLLGQVSFLGLNSHSTASSATLRGKFVREVFLCAAIPAPPAGLNTAIPEATEATPTLRDRVQVHIQNPSCRGCHQLMDPIGLAFENFDGMGRFRLTENGQTIDASGSLNGIFYRDAAELAEVLRDHPDVPRCLVRNLYRYATGHVEVTGETASLRDLATQFEADSYDVLDLFRRMVVDPGFRAASLPVIDPEMP